MKKESRINNSGPALKDNKKFSIFPGKNYRMRQFNLSVKSANFPGNGGAEFTQCNICEQTALSGELAGHSHLGGDLRVEGLDVLCGRVERPGCKSDVQAGTYLA